MDEKLARYLQTQPKAFAFSFNGRSYSNQGTSSNLLLKIASQLTNWMGDDGFLKRAKGDVSEPYICGDALWIKGKALDKCKEKTGGILYRAVGKIETVNQEGQNVAHGTATIYLPSICNVVEPPILQLE